MTTQRSAKLIALAVIVVIVVAAWLTHRATPQRYACRDTLFEYVVCGPNP